MLLMHKGDSGSCMHASFQKWLHWQFDVHKINGHSVCSKMGTCLHNLGPQPRIFHIPSSFIDLPISWANDTNSSRFKTLYAFLMYSPLMFTSYGMRSNFEIRVFSVCIGKTCLTCVYCFLLYGVSILRYIHSVYKNPSPYIE